jgi:hypothetical protein
MPRPPQQPKRSEIESDELEAYDEVIARMRRVFRAEDATSTEDFDAGDYFGALLTSPPMCAIASRMGRFVRSAGNRDNTYSHADREFVDQVLSADWKTNVIQSVHITDAVVEGVRLEAIEALRYGHEKDLTDEERLLAKFIRQVISGAVDDESYAWIESRMGTRGLVEYTGFILWLGWIMRMMQTLGTANPSDEEIDKVISDLKSGVPPHSDENPELGERHG